MSYDREYDTEEDYRELRKEIEQFRQEKERVRSIIGQIGGMLRFSTKLLNIIFFIFVSICFVVSLVTQGHISILMIDIGLIAVAVKLMIIMHYLSRVSHFQLWIMTSMEWRINEINKLLKNVHKKSVDG